MKKYLIYKIYENLTKKKPLGSLVGKNIIKEKEFLKSFLKYLKKIFKATLTGHSNYVLSLAVLQIGDFASGSDDKTIKIWDSLTWSLKRTLTGHSNWVYSLAVLQKGDLASGSSDKTIKIWDSSAISCNVLLCDELVCRMFVGAVA
jgi:WD40 repeat protein